MRPTDNQNDDSCEVRVGEDTEVLINQNVDDLSENRSYSRADPNSSSSQVQSRYWYPAMRFSVFFRVFIAVDSLVTVVLWLSGGDSEYFIDNIEKYHFRQSVFDVAVISLLKVPLYFLLIHHLERTTILSFDSPQNPTESVNRIHKQLFIRQQKKYIALLCILSFLIFSFALVKGSFILKQVLEQDVEFHSIHRTYYACVIWNIVASVACLVLSGVSGLAMKKLQNQRVMRYYNSLGQEVDQSGKPLATTASLYKLFVLAKPEAGLIVAGSFALLVTTAVQTIAPLFFGRVVDAALKSMADLNRTVMILLLIYLGGAVFSLFRSWMFTLAGQRFVARLRKQLFRSIVLQEIAFFDVNRTGELCNRLASDTQEVQKAVTVNMSMLCRYLLQIIGSLVLMFYLNAALTGVLLAIVPVVSLSAMQYGKFVRKIGKLLQDRLADGGTVAEEALSSMRTVKSFSGETKADMLYSDCITESYKIGKKLALAQGSMDGLFSLLAYGAISAVLWYGGKLVYDNSQDPNTGITAGLLTSFLLYTLQVAMGFALLSSLYGDFMQAVGASVRIFALLDRKPDIFVPSNPLILSSLTGEIEFKNVSFTYPSRPETQVLKGMSFRVEPGQVVALVGPSGGGKSTVVSLIERFYDPNEGEILIGGCDLKLLDLTWFRQQVAMVSQEPTLFACSIKENIAYGREASMDEILEAAKQANAHEFVLQFEQGYDTLVGERGVRLSGGQKQRIAIARALIMNPSLLLLDEATSALDAESEYLVQEAVERAMKGRTVIVIAHRLSTVRSAHKVIVIDRGHIAEMGTHEELLAQHGVYKKLVLRQLTAGQPTRNEDEEKPGDLSQRSPNSHVEPSTDREDGNLNSGNSYSNDGFVFDGDNSVDLIDLK
ncbi:unnamed protein product [Candidula unifasciata]|uniref:Uncharacterized protein n=1 Tax=Candidula unifasciata TaxID=100452 RepID=A0A8S3ZFB3_9EUPU|nr:unnamed protein product [Candidula unifasciata]